MSWILICDNTSQLYVHLYTNQSTVTYWYFIRKDVSQFRKSIFMNVFKETFQSVDN